MVEDNLDKAETTAIPEVPNTALPESQIVDDMPQKIKPQAKKKKKLPLIIGVTAILLLIVAGLVYFFIMRQPSAQQLYDQAYSGSIILDSNMKAYASVKIDSGSTKIDGEFVSNFAGSDSQGTSNLIADTEMSGVPVTIDLDSRSIDNGKQTTNYIRYNSVTSSDDTYSQNVKDYFSPVLSKWVKSTIPDKTDDTSEFSKNGAPVAVDIVTAFMPMSSMTAQDKVKYLAATEKYHVVTVDKGVTETQFKGVDARVLHVALNKDSYKQFNNEMASNLSKSAAYKKSSTQYIDDLFGTSNTFTATVYVAKNTAEFLGIEYKIDFAKPITEGNFNTTMKYIKVSVLLDYDRHYSVQIPETTITEDQFDKLLNI